MKAIGLTKLGKIESLKVISIDNPKPKKDEALIKVLYCGINHLDLLIAQGKRVGPKNFPHVLGSEIVGETKSGDKVAILPWIFCGKCKQCKNGFENICDNGGTFGRNQNGGYAEYITVPKQNIIKLNNDSPLDLVCASVLAGTTAFHLIKRANIKDKSTVLVTGATGGVGTTVVKILKSKKCKIICATSSKEKIKSLKDLGADKVIDVKDLTKSVLDIYPDGIDFVVDLVGGPVWSEGVKTLAKNGTIVFCAVSLDEPGVINIQSTYAKQLNIIGSSGGTRKDLKEVIKLVEKGIIKPVIDTVYPLEKAKEALERIEKKGVFGKILLKVS